MAFDTAGFLVYDGRSVALTIYNFTNHSRRVKRQEADNVSVSRHQKDRREHRGIIQETSWHYYWSGDISH
jgi:hypothetical protein